MAASLLARFVFERFASARLPLSHRLPLVCRVVRGAVGRSAFSPSSDPASVRRARCPGYLPIDRWESAWFGSLVRVSFGVVSSDGAKYRVLRGGPVCQAVVLDSVLVRALEPLHLRHAGGDVGVGQGLGRSAHAAVNKLPAVRSRRHHDHEAAVHYARVRRTQRSLRAALRRCRIENRIWLRTRRFSLSFTSGTPRRPPSDGPPPCSSRWVRWASTSSAALRRSALRSRACWARRRS